MCTICASQVKHLIFLGFFSRFQAKNVSFLSGVTTSLSLAEFLKLSSKNFKFVWFRYISAFLKYSNKSPCFWLIYIQWNLDFRKISICKFTYIRHFFCSHFLDWLLNSFFNLTLFVLIMTNWDLPLLVFLSNVSIHSGFGRCYHPERKTKQSIYITRIYDHLLFQTYFR